MSQIRKFLFETSFDADPDPEPEPEPVVEEPAPEPPAPTFSEAELEAARSEGFATGHAQGEASERARAERMSAEALERISEALSRAEAELAAIRPAAEQRGLEVGIAVARKLLPDLMRREGAAEVEALLRECLRDLFDEPRLVLRVPDALLDRITQRVTSITSRSGFSGRLILVADEGMADADCRVEWADGGVERSSARLWREIEGAVARCFAPMPSDLSSPNAVSN